MRLDLGRNPRPVVADLNDYTAVFAIGSKPKLALPAHRIDGIIDDVGPNLIKLTSE
jgi:hypothetical protein